MPAELPLIVRKPIWPTAIVVTVAAAGVAILWRGPSVYSDPLRFYAMYALSLIAGVGLMLLALRKPDLVISADGIQALSWGEQFVRWDEIDCVFLVKHKGVEHLCLKLRDADNFYARSKPLVRLAMTAARSISPGDLMFTPSSLRLDKKEVLNLISLLTTWHQSDIKPPPSAVRYRMD